MSEKITIRNTSKTIHVRPSGKPEKPLILKPGENEVDAAGWAHAKKHPVVQQEIASKLFVELAPTPAKKAEINDITAKDLLTKDAAAKK